MRKLNHKEIILKCVKVLRTGVRDKVNGSVIFPFLGLSRMLRIVAERPYLAW